MKDLIVLKERPRTKIICTLGPDTSSKKAIKKLLENGMSIARINFSHGSTSSRIRLIENIKYIRNKYNKHISIALDTKGPEYRTVLKNPIEVKTGDKVIFVDKDRYNESLSSYTDHVIGLKVHDLHLLKQNDNIYIDDTKLKLTISSISSDHFIAIAQNPFTVKSNKRVAFPSYFKFENFLQEQDKKDLKFGIENDIDIIFLSFTESADNIKSVRNFIQNYSIQIVAKVETEMGIDNIEEIIDASDGIMIARGDLCTNVGISRMFSRMKLITKYCKHKPLIMATEMMLSMVDYAVPTRAEISDVGNAVIDGCDCVMLSSETANGNYPYRSVDIMRKVCLDAEKFLNSFDINKSALEVINEMKKDIEIAKNIKIFKKNDLEGPRKYLLLKGVEIELEDD